MSGLYDRRHASQNEDTISVQIYEIKAIVL